MFVAGEQAVTDRTVGSEPEAIAGAAERPRHARYDADLAVTVQEAVAVRRGRVEGALTCRFEWPYGVDAGEDLLAWHYLRRSQVSSASRGMNSMNRTTRPVSRPKAARSTISSSLTPAITTTLIFTGASPAASAASIASRTFDSEPRRRTAAKRSGRNESQLMLTRFKPAATSSAAMRARPVPFEVIERSEKPTLPSLATRSTIPARDERLATCEADRVDPEACGPRGQSARSPRR